MMKPVSRLLGKLALSAGFWLISPAVAAACDCRGRSFWDYVSTASRVVVGTVRSVDVEPNGDWAMAFAVDQVLVGPHKPGTTLRIKGAGSYALGCFRLSPLPIGLRMALAFDPPQDVLGSCSSPWAPIRTRADQFGAVTVPEVRAALRNRKPVPRTFEELLEFRGRQPPPPWVVASAQVDVDRDGRKDEVRIETTALGWARHPACQGCSETVSGDFVAAVTLAASGRTVRTPLSSNRQRDILRFPMAMKGSALVVADYNGDRQPDFNLGQAANSSKWEYALYTLLPDGSVERLAWDAPRIFVAPGGAVSTRDIEVIPRGIRFHDSGHGGPRWTFTCAWKSDRALFDCSSKQD